MAAIRAFPWNILLLWSQFSLRSDSGISAQFAHYYDPFYPQSLQVVIFIALCSRATV